MLFLCHWNIGIRILCLFAKWDTFLFYLFDFCLGKITKLVYVILLMGNVPNFIYSEIEKSMKKFEKV